MDKAVVLLSGGLDSTTCLAIAKSKGFDCYALSFHYAQRNVSEINAVEKITKTFKVHHKILTLPMNEIGGSSLTDLSIEVPEFQEHRQEIPSTYVPARNTIFLSLALGYAEVVGATHIFIGINAVDYSNYPDCRPEYLKAFQKMANLATKAGVEGHTLTIEAPLMYLSKEDIIKLGTDLGVDYSMTVTCYNANERGEACGYCDSCGFRKKGFDEAGISDPTHYVK